MMIADILSIHRDQQGYFINLPSNLISINTEDSIFDFRNKQLKENPDIYEVKFYTEDLDCEFSGTTPLTMVMQKDFYLKINSDMFFIMSTNNPLLEKNYKIDLNGKVIRDLSQVLNNTDLQEEILTKFIYGVTRNLAETDSKQIEKNTFKQNIMEVLSRMSIDSSKKLEAIQKQILFLDSKLQTELKIKEKVEFDLYQKSKKRLNKLFAFILGQVFAVQYGTYVAFSWDIMEPITCMLGILDVIIAYSYWMMKNSEYQFDNVQHNYVQKRIKQKLREENYDLEQINELNQMIERLNMKKVFLTHDYNELFELLDIKKNE